MSIEKPLHVQVAEALGWTDCDATAKSWPWEFTDPPDERVVTGLGIPPGRSSRMGIPHYDTDWSATGPLIEKYGISVYLADGMWSAQIGDYNDPLESLAVTHSGDQKRPLVVVCELLMLMAATGKLKAA